MGPAVREMLSKMPIISRDTRINLETVLSKSKLLTDQQIYIIALATSYAQKNWSLSTALTTDASSLGINVTALKEDAFAAVEITTMNSIYYRFRKNIGKNSYLQKPVKLRMNRLAHTETTRPDFDLACFAVAVVRDCDTCMKAYETSILGLDGFTEDTIIEAVRIVAVISALGAAL